MQIDWIFYSRGTQKQSKVYTDKIAANYVWQEHINLLCLLQYEVNIVIRLKVSKLCTKKARIKFTGWIVLNLSNDDCLSHEIQFKKIAIFYGSMLPLKIFFCTPYAVYIACTFKMLGLKLVYLPLVPGRRSFVRVC